MMVETVPGMELERRLRLAAGEVGRASRVLGLPAYERTRIALPPPKAEKAEDDWGDLTLFPVRGVE
jgi:hypothetical protein